MSKELMLTAAEEKLAAIIWREMPINSMDLVALALQELSWKKSTTFTVLRKLCGKGVFENQNAVVSALMTREQLLTRQSRWYVEDSFGGSLPQFITSFFGGKKMSEAQTEELYRLIEQYERGESGDFGG